jgi:putative membrane protein
MSWAQVHPAINAALNLTCFIFLVAGRIAIARGDSALHKKRMLTALGVACVFLVSYLLRVAMSGTHRYPGPWGWDKTAYIAILSSHTVLAAALVPLVIVTVRRALKGNFVGHRRIVQLTFPMWMYVSVTGVIVYVMLYHLAPVLHPQ